MYIHVRLFLRQRFHGTDFTESGCRCGQEYLRSIYDRSYKAVEFYVGGPRVTHSNGLKKYSVSQDVGKTYKFKITVGDCNQSKERKPVTGFTVASGRGVKNRSNGGVEKRKKKHKEDNGGNRKREAEERRIGPTTNVKLCPAGRSGRAQTSQGPMLNNAKWSTGSLDRFTIQRKGVAK